MQSVECENTAKNCRKLQKKNALFFDGCLPLIEDLCFRYPRSVCIEIGASNVAGHPHGPPVLRGRTVNGLCEASLQAVTECTTAATPGRSCSNDPCTNHLSVIICTLAPGGIEEIQHRPLDGWFMAPNPSFYSFFKLTVMIVVDPISKIQEYCAESMHKAELPLW